MKYKRPTKQASKARNRAGCPYLNQKGVDAVLGWSNMLAAIDPATLPAELQAELCRLQHTSCASDCLVAAR